MHNSSLFASPLGLVALLGAAITALYDGASLIAAFLLLILLLCASARLWSRSVLNKTELTLSDGQTACHAGETIGLTLRVRSRSFFPLIWLDVCVPLGETLILAQETDEAPARLELPTSRPVYVLRERFAWLLWQQEIACEETLRAVRRGIVPVERISLQAGDGLGMAACQRWSALRRPIHFFVYPRLMHVDVRPFLRLLSDAETGARGEMEDVTLLKSSRPYRHGDPMKRINWRYLAMTGRMEINQYETVTPGCITFVLDLFSFRYTDFVTAANGAKERQVFLREDELERMISLVASCICALQEQGQRFALIIPGYAQQESVVCRPGSGDAAMQLAMEALAAVAYRGEEAQLPADEIRRLRRKLGVIHLCAYSSAPTISASMEALGCARLRAIACVRDAQAQSTGELACTLLEELAPDEAAAKSGGSASPAQPTGTEGGAA
ncbi:MAG: DUF58 domain-containing protein [Clostridia bacterium]|nr:DUF58 domain-containing protein [Clostridia bacterium]